MKLRQIEANVLEYNRQGKTKQEIAILINKSMVTVNNILRDLHDLNAVERTGRGKYICIVTDYEIVSNKKAEESRGGKLPPIQLPDGYEFYIRNHYEKIPRRELAKRLRMKKVDLNMVLIQLGYGREKKEKEEKCGA